MRVFPSPIRILSSLVAIFLAIFGAAAGQILPVTVVETAMGFTILGIVILMILSKNSTFPDVPKPDKLSSALGISGVFTEATLGRKSNWKVHRTPISLLLFRDWRIREAPGGRGMPGSGRESKF